MFFKTNNLKIRKSVTVYISESKGQIIIAPKYVNKAGISYEQDICTLMQYPINDVLLGAETLRNFNLFCLKDKNLRDQKLTDWPAFKYSKLKTVKQFEAVFSRISIDGLNEANISISIEACFANDNDLIIKSITSANEANNENIGKQIMKVYRHAFKTLCP
jgi:hypothetical protein